MADYLGRQKRWTRTFELEAFKQAPDADHRKLSKLTEKQKVALHKPTNKEEIKGAIQKLQLSNYPGHTGHTI